MGDNRHLHQVFEQEAKRVCCRIDTCRRDEDAIVLVVSDVHHVPDDNWDATSEALRIVVDSLHPDAIVQLGDLVDGDRPWEQTQTLAAEVLEPLRALDAPLYGCIGNHDFNCYGDDERGIARKTAAEFYLGREDEDYFVDIEGKNLRLVFLGSFERARPNEFGFSKSGVHVLGRALSTLAPGQRALVFTHVVPLVYAHRWSDAIEHGEQVIDLIEGQAKTHPGSVLACVSAHGHADLVSQAGRVPIVTVGCARFAPTEAQHTLWGNKPARVAGQASEALFDIAIARHDEPRMEFVRFGAGVDRSVRAW